MIQEDKQLRVAWSKRTFLHPMGQVPPSVQSGSQTSGTGGNGALINGCRKARARGRVKAGENVAEGCQGPELMERA